MWYSSFLAKQKWYITKPIVNLSLHLRTTIIWVRQISQYVIQITDLRKAQKCTSIFPYFISIKQWPSFSINCQSEQQNWSCKICHSLCRHLDLNSIVPVVIYSFIKLTESIFLQRSNSKVLKHVFYCKSSENLPPLTQDVFWEKDLWISSPHQ